MITTTQDISKWARFFLHLFTILFCPLRARAFFDMLPLDHPPPGLCWFVLCTSCGFCFDLPRDHPMFGVHLLSFAPLWVLGFLLNLFWARFRPSTRPRHAWGSLRFFAQGSFCASFGPVLTFHATTPCLVFITVCTRFFLHLFWASTRPPHAWGSLRFAHVVVVVVVVAVVGRKERSRESRQPKNNEAGGGLRGGRSASPQ